MATDYMSGKVDVSLNGITIPAKYLGDDGATTTLEEGTIEISTLEGTFTKPNGTFEEVSTKFTLVLPNMSYLKNIFPNRYTASNDRPTVAGRTAIGGDTCFTMESTPVVVHYSCDSNSDNDVYIPNGYVSASIELQQNISDPVMVEVTVNGLPSEDHDNVRAYLGTGSLSGETLWNAEDEVYEAITS